MNDCINREAFISEIEKHYCAPCKGQGGDLGGDWCRSCVINSVLEKLREFPAADVVPAVRCQDCVYAHPLKDMNYDYLCHYWNGHSCNQNQFCSQGKRKEKTK